MRSIICFVMFLSVACTTTQKGNPSFKLGNEYARDGLYREALSSYRTAQKQEPDNPAIVRNIGIVELKLGLYEKAVISLTKSLSYFTNNFETNYYLAEALRGKNDLDNAIFRYQRALEINPKDLQAKKGLAWCLMTIDRLDLAKSLLAGKGLEKDPQAIILSARILVKQGRAVDALSLLQSIEGKTSAFVAPYLASAIGDVQLALKNPKESLKQHLLALKTVPLMFSALLGAANAHLELKQIDRSKILAEQASRVQPNNPAPWRTLANIAKASGNAKEAELAQIEFKKRKPLKSVATSKESAATPEKAKF
ncbi:MAG: tetratricopeptide repeat protein [Pseudomonadota bacterium]